jgi:hypothetical protein
MDGQSWYKKEYATTTELTIVLPVVELTMLLVVIVLLLLLAFYRLFTYDEHKIILWFMV